jgi:hypothetical protein
MILTMILTMGREQSLCLCESLLYQNRINFRHRLSRSYLFSAPLAP